MLEVNGLKVFNTGVSLNSALITNGDMIGRILGTGVGVFLILFVLLSRGLPVLFFIKMFPLILILLVASALIWAGLTSD